MITRRPGIPSLPLMALALCLMLLYWLPYALLGEQSHIAIHDNLDSSFVYYKILLDSGQLCAMNDAIVPQFMGGLPRGSFPSELSFTALWFYLLTPFRAYVFERLAIPLVAYFGMYLLLSRFILPDRRYEFVRIGTSLCFALLPFWPFGGLSVAGLPLLSYAFLELKSGTRLRLAYSIIAIFPFYSSPILSGVFFVALSALWWIYDALRTRRPNVRWALGLALLLSVYALTNYRLVYSFFIASGYVSHRQEFSVASHLQGAAAAFRSSFDMLVFGQYHARSLQTPIILPAAAIGLIAMWKARKIDKIFFAIVAILIATSLFYGFWRSGQPVGLHRMLWSIMPLNLGRFHWLHPLLWSVLFALCLALILDRLRYGALLVRIALGLQLVYAFSYHEIFRNRDLPTFEEFYAEPQFAEIARFIGRPFSEYRVVSIGVHPSITQYNGFYTLDGYIADYPLSYKHRFRAIIAGELRKNPALQAYFDRWGSRAYAMPASNIGYLNRKNNVVAVDGLDLNVAVFRSMGGQYLISAVRLDPQSNPDWILEQRFCHEKSAWDIYLYKLR